MSDKSYLIPTERVENAIREIRGVRVMLDTDLAAVYGVKTKALVQAVKRNLDRFPASFMFQLTSEEASNLRSQSVTSRTWGGRRYLPYAFTEHGAVMLASVLKTKRAVEVSVFVVRAFIKMRRMMTDQRQFALKLAEIESKLAAHDENFKVVFGAIRQLMQKPRPEPVKPPRKIGFEVREPMAKYDAGVRRKRSGR